MPAHREPNLVLAQKIRALCIETLTEAYETAGLSGLCAEGRWEAALGALAHLDLKKALDASQKKSTPRKVTPKKTR